MATPPVSSITPPPPPSNSSVVFPPVTQPNGTSTTTPPPPPSSPSTPATSSPPPPAATLSPPPPDLQFPPFPPITLPPTAAPPPPFFPPSPSPSAATSSPPPPIATSSPPQIFSPPLESSPPPPSKSSPPQIFFPPPPSKLSPPSKSSPPLESSPPPPAESSPAPFESSPPPPLQTSPPLDFAPPPPPEDISPLPPIATSSPPTPITFTPPTNSSTNGTLETPIAFLPTRKPTPGMNDSLTAILPKGGGSGGMNLGTAAAVGVVFGFLALSVVVMAVWLVRRRKRRNGSGDYVMPSPFASSRDSELSFMKAQNSPKLAENSSGTNIMYSSDLNSKSWFTYEELSEATQGFSSQKLLGEGGFGCVYKGLLVDGREVAVKQLKIGGGQGEREFRAEVDIISRVHHRYLVSLVGYCISDHQRLLVYEYLPNDTLYYHLHGKGRPVMEWSTRVKVASGAARGIAYLHEDCHPRIIHRDIKSSNILLDSNFDARVADFGLAKLAADANTHVTTRVMGTFGYMAPEYASSGKLTEKSDVFSYGVVLLELITGRKPVDGTQPLGDESLVEWARPLLSEALENDKYKDLIDPRLENNYVEFEMFRMIEAAAACIRHLAPKRPRMSQVVRAFDSLNEYPDLTNGIKLGQSKNYDPREQSAQIKRIQRMAFGSQDFDSDYFDRTHSSWNSSKLGPDT